MDIFGGKPESVGRTNGIPGKLNRKLRIRLERSIRNFKLEKLWVACLRADRVRHERTAEARDETKDVASVKTKENQTREKMDKRVRG